MDIKKVVEKLIDKKISIATAESITGGLIAKTITDVAGSSAILKESFITYSDESKVAILGVDPSIIDKYGVVSKEVAKDMCEKLYKLTGRDICVSTTGNAGPTVCDDKPIGRVYVGIDFKGKTDVIELELGDIGRDKVRESTLQNVFELIDKITK